MSERDWQKDWELCHPYGGCVTPPPWKVEDRAVWYKGMVAWHPLVFGSRCTSYDLQFIAEARTGWPAALERVMKLEEVLNKCLQYLRDECYENCNETYYADNPEECWVENCPVKQAVDLILFALNKEAK